VDDRFRLADETLQAMMSSIEVQVSTSQTFVTFYKNYLIQLYIYMYIYIYKQYSVCVLPHSSSQGQHLWMRQGALILIEALSGA
jgi:hypothetical protein